MTIRVMPTVAVAVALLLAVLPAPHAAAQAGSTGAPDVNADSRQRSMAYFQMKVDPSTRERLSEEQLSRIENMIRGQINSIGRFEQVPIGVDAETPKDFVEKFQAYLMENAGIIARLRQEDRGEDYDFRYASTIVTGDAMRQVLNSAYAYQIVVGPLRLATQVEGYRARFEQVEVAHRVGPTLPLGRRGLPEKLRHDRVTGNLVFTSLEEMTDEERKAYLRFAGIDIDAEDYEPDGGSAAQQLWHRAIDDLYRLSRSEPKTPRFEQRQGKYITAEFGVSVTFVKIRVLDDNDEPVPVEQAVQRVTGGSMTVRMFGRQEPGMYLLEPDTRTWLELLIANRRQLAAVRREAERRRQVGERQAIDGAANSAIGGIGTWVRTIQEFVIRAQVVQIGEGYVTQRPGRKEGLRIDDYSYIYSAGPNNTKIPVGWGYVTQLGPGYVASSESVSMAHKEETYVTLRTGAPSRGDMIEEYAMYGVAVNVSIGGEFLLGSNASDQIGADTLAARKGSFMISLNPMFNVGRYSEISQLWAGIDARINLGSDMLFFTIGLEVEKKFTFGALGVSIAAAGGITGYFLGGGTTEMQAVANHLFNIGATTTQPQANQVVQDNNLESPLLFYVALTPRVEYFFSPNLRIFIQLNVQLTSAAAEATIGAFTLDGSAANRAHIPGFSWSTFGLGALIGASFEF